jgi:hypothetical protein
MKAKKNTIKIAAQAEGQKKNVTEIEYNFWTWTRPGRPIKMHRKEDLNRL